MDPTASQLLALCRKSRDDLNNWMRANLLSKEIPETTQGVARRMSRAAALEVAFMAKLTDLGFSLRHAATLAQGFVEQERTGRLLPWFLFDPDAPSAKFPCTDLTAETLPISQAFLNGPDDEAAATIVDPNTLYDDDDAPRGTTGYRVVHLGEIVRRIDKLFAAPAK